MNLQLLNKVILGFYTNNVRENVLEKHDKLQESDLSIDTFSFYTSVSAVFSSKIEGEEIKLDSYIKHKKIEI